MKILIGVLLLVVVLVASLGVPATIIRASEPDPEIEIRFDGGQVGKLYIKDGAGWVIVDGTKFLVNEKTDIREDAGMLVPYAFVDVRAVRHDGKLCATRITVLGEDPEEVTFEGAMVTKLALDHYKVVVGMTKFITNADTEIPEGLTVGDVVRVEAERMDGKLIATRISILD